LDAIWAVPDESDDCTYFLRLRKNNTYALGTSCFLVDGGEGISVDQGRYEAQEGVLTFYPEEGSCPGDFSEPFTLRYHFPTKDQLAVQDETGGFVFDRYSASDFDSGSPTFGCFNEEGLFTPNPIAPLLRT
jgi:hypothetical protein